MTIATTVAALQALHATVTGITSAPTVMPASINTADLPMVLTIPGAGTWTRRAFDQAQQERVYLVRVFVGPTGQGTVDEAFDAALPILQAMGVVYLAWTLTDVVYDMDFTDSGLDGRLLFGGQEYRGFEFRLTVREVL